VALSELRSVILALGYRSVIEAGQEIFVAKPRRRATPESLGRPRRPREGHPFAKLKELKFA